MSEVEDPFVKRGFWINTHQGPVLGTTITVESTVANVIIALLTVLITGALAQLWNLLTFLYHQARAKGGPSDGLFWQQQALLRTLPTPASFISNYIKLWWVWRGRANRPFARSILPTLPAILFVIGTVASGIFSAYAVDTSNIEVLVKSPLCGRWSTDQLGLDSTRYMRLAPVIQAYNTDCYQDTEKLPSRCHNTFVKPNVSITWNAAECPWDKSMCLQPSLPAVSMDSGLLDLSHFGFNIEPQNGVMFRKKTVCNVLPLDPYLTVHSSADFLLDTDREPLPDEKVIALNYTLSLDPDSGTISAYPYVASMIEVNVSRSYKTEGSISWAESSYPTYHNTTLARIIPIAAMNRTDADVAVNVIWLNNVQYTKSNSDPLFSAHTRRNWTKSGWEGFKSDHPAGAVGCAVQYQFCIKRKDKDDLCTELMGLPETITRDTWPEATEIQLLILQLLRDISTEMDVSTGPYFGVIQAAELSDDHWKTEVIGWETFAWAGIQTLLADYAIGPKGHDPDADQYMIWPTTKAEKELCGSMRMRKSGGFA
ncbi:hypothetical protein BS50DRAFT_616909 [Corynespora cassiicola Philippines]|uniref:Uncharacterized protein n=1 Tax=Corynespora cassiicola Philippines TaxID=1448308 RepID=A0A2T2P7B9_CORCC|nr:hypothetical protein BS50DRAFT_616909 [Corynespora cassiicola Philippines]